METTAHCTDTITIRHTGEGTAGVHTTKISLMPGQYAITGGGTAGSAVTTVKLEDAAGNLFDLPNSDASGVAPIPGAYPVAFTTPGCSLRISEASATGATDLTYTIGKLP